MNRKQISRKIISCELQEMQEEQERDFLEREEGLRREIESDYEFDAEEFNHGLEEFFDMYFEKAPDRAMSFMRGICNKVVNEGIQMEMTAHKKVCDLEN